MSMLNIDTDFFLRLFIGTMSHDHPLKVILVQWTIIQSSYFSSVVIGQLFMKLKDCLTVSSRNSQTLPVNANLTPKKLFDSQKNCV